MIASVRCPQLIGRSEETAFLRERLVLAERGHGSVIFISGDAGIGKTRLVGDFLQLPELRRIPRAIGFCMEHARSPLAPLVDIIWSICDESPTLLDDAPVTRRVLARLMPSLARDDDRIESTSDVRSQYAAIFDLFRRAGEKRPIVIVIDDAQWADLSTVDFITFLGARLADARVMLLVMHRPAEDGDRLTDSIARLRNNASVHGVVLRPLTTGDMHRLSALALGKASPLSADLLRQVYALADGNPLFAEELLGTALDSPASALTLPASLRALFLDRFSTLDADDREILTEAAVMGRSFDPVFLAQLTHRPIERILRTLRNARELQLVDDEGSGIVFRHALVREALYASLLREEARRLHRRMAEELVSLPETMVRISALAYHWWSAREPLKAFDANVLAGERAMAAGTTTDAAVFFERALTCAPDDEAARAAIECRLGAALFSSGFSDRAFAAYTRALAVYRREIDMRKIAEVLIELGRQSAALADGTSAHRWRLEAIEAADAVPDDRSLQFATLAHVANTFAIRGDIDRSRDLIARARALETEAPFRARFDMIEAEIFCDLLSGEFVRAESAFADLRVLVGAEGTTTQLVRAYANNAFVQGFVGNITVALERATYALGHCDDALVPAYHLSALGILGAILLKAGDLAGAATQLAHAERLIARSGQDTSRFTSPLVELAVLIGIHAGRPDLLERYLDPKILDEAFGSCEYFWISTKVEAFIVAAAAVGDRECVRLLLQRLFAAHPPAPLSPMLALACAEFGDDAAVDLATNMFAGWSDETSRSIAAFRALFDAYVARRSGHSPVGLARDAGQRFEAAHLPLFAAQAFALAGDERRALTLYERHGCTADAQRLRARSVGETPASRTLSARENEVLPHVLRGRSNAEIGRDLSISERTVESHVRSILAKRGVKTRLQLLRIESPEHE